MLRWLAKTIFLLLVLAVVVGGALVGVSHLNYKQVSQSKIPDADLTLQVEINSEFAPLGRKIAQIKGCYDCHGVNLAGHLFIEDPALGVFAGPNLTSGQGSVTREYSDADWVRAIRYGVNRQSHYLRFMPSNEFSALSDEDLAKLIAYLKSVPAVDNKPKAVNVGPLAKVLYLAGKFPFMFPGELIDRSVRPPVHVNADESTSYGKYLSSGCVGCHGPHFKGGPIPGVPPNWPPAADLSRTGRFRRWTFNEFKRVLSEGMTPDGRKLNSTFMPWTSFSAMSDSDMKAIYNYLQSL